ncbi:MAG: hypothetical protein ACYCVZ_00285 [Streptosporangiaceae bacterium]
MMPSFRSSSPEVNTLRAAAMDIEAQLLDQAREQARRIHSGASGDLAEADIQRLAGEMAAAARARLDAAIEVSQSTSADPELETTRRGATQILAAAVRDAEAEMLKAWRARYQKRSLLRRRR